MTITYGFSETPFGDIIAARTPQGLCDLQFLTHDRMGVIHELAQRWGQWTDTTQDDRVARRATDFFFRHEGAELKLDLRGTAFQLEVWRALLDIPFGQTTTYEAVASRIGRPQAIRSVATAIGHNPIALLVPCHRVIHKDGTPGEYRWGRELKKRLLEWERSLSPNPSPIGEGSEVPGV